MVAEDRPAGFFVTTHSCYAAICDEGSLASRPGFMDAEWAAAGRAAREAGQEDYWRLFHFNDRLMRLAEQGELLAWALLFDGVFRAVVDTAPHTPSQPSPSNLGAQRLGARLLCPTGRLVLTCMTALGTRQRPFVEVDPGAYEVVVLRDDDQELRHGLIELADYAAGDGPDWRIAIRPA